MLLIFVDATIEDNNSKVISKLNEIGKQLKELSRKS